MSKLEPIFPFTLRRSGPQGSDAIYQLFLANRPKGETWFEYDATIVSRRKVTFVAYHRDVYRLGHRGDEAFRVSGDCTLGDTKETVARRLDDLAEREWHAREVVKRNEAVAKVRKELVERNRRVLS